MMAKFVPQHGLNPPIGSQAGINFYFPIFVNSNGIRRMDYFKISNSARLIPQITIPQKIGIMVFGTNIFSMPVVKHDLTVYFADRHRYLPHRHKPNKNVQSANAY